MTGIISAIRYGLPTWTVDYRMPPGCRARFAEGA